MAARRLVRRLRRMVLCGDGDADAGEHRSTTPTQESCSLSWASGGLEAPLPTLLAATDAGLPGLLHPGVATRPACGDPPTLDASASIDCLEASVSRAQQPPDASSRAGLRPCVASPEARSGFTSLAAACDPTLCDVASKPPPWLAGEL